MKGFFFFWFNNFQIFFTNNYFEGDHIYTKEKEFVCEACSKNFTQIWNLKHLLCELEVKYYFLCDIYLKKKRTVQFFS